MLNRWIIWPQGVRWAIGLGVVVVAAVGIGWVLFVPTSDWLAAHDVGSVHGQLLQTARDDARGQLLTLGAGLVAVAALVFTARNFTLARRTTEVTRRTFELAEQGQVTDRYMKAIDQVGSDKLDVRIGGIYALERVALDSSRDHSAVMEVLAAFIREHSWEQSPVPTSGDTLMSEGVMRADIQAALTVIGRRRSEHDLQRIDLSSANLSGADLHDADLENADLNRARLIGANLIRARLARASLVRTDLTAARLVDADLTEALLSGAKLVRGYLGTSRFVGASIEHADFTDALLIGADLSNSYLGGTVFIRADLRTANLAKAFMAGVQLAGARLNNALLEGAYLAEWHSEPVDLVPADYRGTHLDAADVTGADLTDADLAGARWAEGTSVPEGWVRDRDSGVLERNSTNSGETTGN